MNTNYSKTDWMTMKQVAGLYKVTETTIENCYFRNKAEIDQDGVSVINIESPERNMTHSNLTEDNKGVTCFHKRAVLRIAMLLNDNEFAKEICSYILDALETVPDVPLLRNIFPEVELIYEIGQAFASGTNEELSTAIKKYSDYQIKA